MAHQRQNPRFRRSSGRRTGRDRAGAPLLRCATGRPTLDLPWRCGCCRSTRRRADGRLRRLRRPGDYLHSGWGRPARLSGAARQKSRAAGAGRAGRRWCSSPTTIWARRWRRSWPRLSMPPLFTEMATARQGADGAAALPAGAGGAVAETQSVGRPVRSVVTVPPPCS